MCGGGLGIVFLLGVWLGQHLLLCRELPHPDQGHRKPCSVLFNCCSVSWVFGLLQLACGRGSVQHTCYWFWNRALGECQGVSLSVTGDNSVCLGQGFNMFKYNLSSVPAFVFLCMIMCRVLWAACVPVYLIEWSKVTGNLRLHHA